MQDAEEAIANMELSRKEMESAREEKILSNKRI
jgi:hypothetical protein